MLRARLSRLLAPLCVGGVFFGLTVAACSVPEFEFPPAPGPSVAGDGSVIIDHCVNGLLDADVGESDFDCGGGCAPCGAGQHCADVADCVEGLLCHDGSCLEAGCMNGAQDGAETDMDCGGDACKACITGQACSAKTDCDSGVCGDGKCLAPACDDQTKNGKETGLDCGGDCPGCPADEPCVAGKDCISGECNDGVCGTECPDGFANCDAHNDNACEINTKTDVSNCGSCGNVCQLPHATAECSAGECHIATDGCATGYADCNGDPADGCEVNLEQDKLNCGACAKVCPEINGAPFCSAGACQITCSKGFDDCDDKRENGCEKDVSKDVNNCGVCGKKCTPTSGGTAYCKDDTCGETICPAGLGDCNGNPDDGCEVDLRIDKNNCNTCGNLCLAANGTASCNNRVCQIATCDKGYANCSGGYADGCETNTNTDTGACGGCGKACTIDNGSPRCDLGVCGVNSCSGTFRDCNNDPKDGCEINIATSPKNCGGCGAAGSDCSTKYANATSTCSASSCQPPTCNSGFGDCSGGIADGCETNTTNDVDNCGTCGKTCLQGGAGHVSTNDCVGSLCKPICSGSYLTCDNKPENGCEADSLTDESNCGMCGSACSSAASAHVTSNLCSGGACDPQCSGTYGDCDSSRTNGCEIDTASSDNNCGGCGKVCDKSAAAHVTGNSCSGSTCHPTCNNLYADCDSSRLNGCEKDVSSDVNNCGACNTTCTATQHASAGTKCTTGACAPSCDAGWGNCTGSNQGCPTQLTSTANCTKCGQTCSGGTPFCDPAGCVDHRDIVVVNTNVHAVAGWDASQNVPSEIKLDHSLTTPKIDPTSNRANNRMLIVGVGCTDNFTNPENVSVTYAGTPMNVAVEQEDAGKHSYAGIYYLLDSGLPDSAGTTQVVASFGPGFMWGHAGIHVMELKNTMQVAPIATGSGFGDNCGASGSRSATATFTQTGSLVYAVLGARGATSATLSSATGLTEVWNEYQPTPDKFLGAAAWVFDNDNRTITWNVNNCYNSATVIAAIKRLNWN